MWTRIDIIGAADGTVLGTALHACLAADLVAGESGLSSSDLGAIVSRFGVADVVESVEIHVQILAIRAWLRGR